MTGGGVSVPSGAAGAANTPSIASAVANAPVIRNPANFTPTAFASSGFTGAFSGGGVSISEMPEMSSRVAGLETTFGNEANAFQGLLGTVQPGFSQLRQAGLAAIENSRQQTVSNLSDNLAQRRVLGSSFASNSISQSNADFAQKAADFTAQSYLQELSASQQLTQQEFAAKASQYQSSIQQYNLEAAMSADLSSKTTSVLASVAETQAQLQLQEQQLMVQEQQMMLQASEFNAQMKASEMAGLGSGLGSILGMFGGMSDIRLKENIVQVGTTVHGLPLYHFNYIGDEQRYEGVMAQEVLKVMPDAVFEHGGYYGVLYNRLGIELRSL